MYLIAGLGNPGEKYKNTRHNIGFLVIDEITKNLSTTNINNPTFKAIIKKSLSNFYVKPQTFMNNSGESIVAIANYYNIPNENIIVIHDDLDLSFGTIKFKCDGGHGGHNGLRSIDNHIGKDYIDDIMIKKIQDKLNDNLCEKIIKDTATATGWIHDTIKLICQKKGLNE